MLTPNPKSLSTVVGNSQMAHGMSCIMSLPTQDSSRRRHFSVEILYSNDPDLDEVSSGATEFERRYYDKFCADSADEGEFEKCACELKQLGIVQKTSALESAEDGFQVQTPFLPGRIQVNARTGRITILPADEQEYVCKANVIIPRNIQAVTAPTTGRGPTSTRRLLPGRLVALRHSVELTFLRVEHSDGTLHADRSIARSDEVFAVVSVPVHENAFALKSVGRKTYLRCRAEGDVVLAICDEWTLSEKECFMEEDPGENFTALRSVKYNQYLGGGVGGHPVKLFSKIAPDGKFQVLPILTPLRRGTLASLS